MLSEERVLIPFTLLKKFVIINLKNQNQENSIEFNFENRRFNIDVFQELDLFCIKKAIVKEASLFCLKFNKFTLSYFNFKSPEKPCI